MAYEYYDFLGIDHYTDKDDINRSCKRKRRVLTIDNDNEGLQYLNQVQQTLLDEHSRTSYDEMQEFGDNISALLETASEQMEKEEWEDATRSLKQLLALAPKQVVARNLLGICYIREGEYDEAIKIYDKLLAECPDTPLYWANAGYVYSEKSSEYPLKLSNGQLKSECPNCEEINFLKTKNRAFVYKCEHCEKSYLIHEETKDVWLTKARKYYLKAVDLEPYNHEYYINVAATYEHELLYQQAVDWIEKGISADGKVDFDDFDDLFYLCRIYSHMDLPDKMVETAKRIELLVPDDIAEAREYAAYRFLKFAHELSEIKIFDVAARFAKCALVINPEDNDIIACYKYYDAISCALEEYEIMMNDSIIINPMKRLAGYSLFVITDENNNEKENKRILANILDEFDSFTSEHFITSLNRLKKLYNDTYRLDIEFYDECEKRVTGKISSIPSNVSAPSVLFKPQNTIVVQSSSSNKTGTLPKSDSTHNHGFFERYWVAIGWIACIILLFALITSYNTSEMNGVCFLSLIPLLLLLDSGCFTIIWLLLIGVVTGIYATVEMLTDSPQMITAVLIAGGIALLAGANGVKANKQRELSVWQLRWLYIQFAIGIELIIGSFISMQQ